MATLKNQSLGLLPLKAHSKVFPVNQSPNGGLSDWKCGKNPRL